MKRKIWQHTIEWNLNFAVTWLTYVNDHLSISQSKNRMIFRPDKKNHSCHRIIIDLVLLHFIVTQAASNPSTMLVCHPHEITNSHKLKKILNVRQRRTASVCITLTTIMVRKSRNEIIFFHLKLQCWAGHGDTFGGYLYTWHSHTHSFRLRHVNFVARRRPFNLDLSLFIISS
jgi:hypothetical protein